MGPYGTCHTNKIKWDNGGEGGKAERGAEGKSLVICATSSAILEVEDKLIMKPVVNYNG